MDQFLLITPEGWIELPDAQAFVDTNGEAQLIDLVQSNQMGHLDAMLETAGHVPAGKTLGEFRMFRDTGGYRIWFKLKDL